MSLSVRGRLFLISTALTLALIALGLGLIRWSFVHGEASGFAHDNRTVDALVSGLAQARDQHGSWRFLPRSEAMRVDWLRRRILADAAAAADPMAATLADRLVLEDATGHRLLGTEPARALVAVASLDRRRWTIPAHEGIAGYLTLTVPRDPDDALTVAFLIKRQRSLAVLGGWALALSALAALIVSGTLRRPLRELVAGAHALTRGELGTRLAATRGDELGELARSFNALAARLEANAVSRQQWIADTSHEFRTPLAVLQAQVEAMQDGVLPLSPQTLAAMAPQIASLQALVDDLDQLSRGDTGRMEMALEPIDAWAVFRQTWDDFADRLHARGLHARLSPPSRPARVRGDAERLRQVLRNLLENTARYTARGGSAHLHAHVDADAVRVCLDDSAPGVEATDLPRLGERFFRVDASRSREHGGRGLGLALARQIVEAHGGTLRFEASPAGGLRATIRLPREPA